MRHKKIDLNQTKIVEALRKAGASVFSLAAMGKGCPDLLVGYRNRNFLFEVKNPDASASDQQLTEAEQKFALSWSGQVETIRTLQEAVDFILYYKEK